MAKPSDSNIELGVPTSGVYNLVADAGFTSQRRTLPRRALRIAMMGIVAVLLMLWPVS